ncbi:MAG TPA: hypothetical protein VEX15_19530 [Nocardioidaceae bacterium]|nr:hypothetical protein [Nocardioidaceae bacterium]
MLAAPVMAWISLVLIVDSDGSLAVQRLLGVLTWALLLAVLRRESIVVRVQTGVVVVFATAVEYTFSPLLEVYVYRFDNVPAYVPPGHGLVYLAALSLGRSTFVREHLRGCVAAVVVAGGAYAAWGLTLGPRIDVLGAFWFCCLVGFLAWGPSRPLYVGAFVVVTYLEIVGTALGTWTWQPYDPTGWVPVGNPPSGAAGGYGWFDLAALLLTPLLLGRWRDWGGSRQSVVGAGDPSDEPIGVGDPCANVTDP